MESGCLLSANEAKSVNQHEASVDEAYEAYEALRQHCPVAHSAANGGYYLLLNHVDVRKAAIDWKTFSSALGVGLPQDRTRPALPALEMDPPEHAVWRKLYTDALVPGALKLVETKVEEIADILIDRFERRGACDLVKDFAEPLPVLGISAAIGLQGKKIEDIRELALALTEAAADPERQKLAVARLANFIMQEIHDRRANPQDDYLTTIAQASIGGETIEDGMMTLFMIGFLVAGHESTSSALSGLLFHVLRNDELKRRVVADPNACKAAIEEAVRWMSPFHGFSRTTTTPVSVGNVEIPAGQVVRLCWAAANRDPSVFDDPHLFNIDRSSNQHLGFGVGRHMCAGAPFARLEMRIAVQRLISRLPDITIDEERLNTHFAGGMITLPEHLKARFTPIASLAE